MADAHQLVRTFHSTCMISDYDATVSSLARVAGLRVLEYSEAEYIGRRGGMTWIGDNSMEVAQPIVAGHAAERFLLRFGPGMHSYALQVSNLDSTISHLESNGVKVGVRPAPGFCFTDPRTTGGLLFEWSDFTVDEDPRVGAPTPPYDGEPLLDVQTHAFVGAVIPSPLAWADSYGEMFGLTEAFRTPNAAPGEPVVGLAAPDCVLALYPMPEGKSLSLWGSEHPRARCHVLGLGVPSVDEAAQTLAASGIRVVRRTATSVVVDPAATGEVPLVLIDELLPGDPRR
jgi:hypothetical protein